MIFLYYLIFSMITAIFLSSKTDRKLLCFVLTLWILAQPVINAKYTIPLSSLSFELQPNRILFLFALAYFFWGMFAHVKVQKSIVPPFEKYIYAYLCAVLSAVLLNYEFMRPNEVITAPLEIFTFLIIYILAKCYITEKIFDAIIKAIVILAILGSIIAILQFTVDSTFLRTGYARLAFGDKFRSSGIFGSEYDFGYFQILALIVVFVRYKGKAVCLFLAVMVIISLLLTFHRLNYLILLICSVSYFVFFKKHNVPILFQFIIGISLFIILGLNILIFKSDLMNNKIVEERLMQDTISGRFMQFNVVLDTIIDKPIGLGSYSNPIYIKLMIKNNMYQWLTDQNGRRYVAPLTVHNGYLAAGIQYGVPGMIAFCALVFSMLMYFKNYIDNNIKYSIIPFYAILIFALSNVSNGVNIFRAYFVLLIAILCGAAIALRQNKLHVDSLTI